MGNETVKVGDMYLAAVLLAYGASLKGVDKTNPRRLRFEFSTNLQYMVVSEILPEEPVQLVTITKSKANELDVELADLLQEHYIGQTLWLPPSYPDALKRIKAMIHTQ